MCLQFTCMLLHNLCLSSSNIDKFALSAEMPVQFMYIIWRLHEGVTGEQPAPLSYHCVTLCSASHSPTNCMIFLMFLAAFALSDVAGHTCLISINNNLHKTIGLHTPQSSGPT